MINGLYDFDLPATDYVVYIGAGLGVGHVDVDLQGGPAFPGFRFADGDHTALAGQSSLGVERGLANGMTVFADYTYLHVAEQEYDGFNTNLGSLRPMPRPPILPGSSILAGLGRWSSMCHPDQPAVWPMTSGSDQ